MKTMTNNFHVSKYCMDMNFPEDEFHLKEILPIPIEENICSLWLNCGVRGCFFQDISLLN